MNNSTDKHDWEELYSEKYQCNYYFNKITNEKSWTIPDTLHQIRTNNINNNGKTNNKTDETNPSSEVAGNIIKCISTKHDWEERYSETYQCNYYYNKITNEKSWTMPNSYCHSMNTSKANSTDTVNSHVDNMNQCQNKVESIQSNSNSYIKVAIIVPYRDLHIEQLRSKQLEKFIPYMIKFLSNSSSQQNIQFHIYIIEQSNDMRKFNRGKLLNIGFKIAKDNLCNIFIFHDVDLLPSEHLLVDYTTMPINPHPVHIARIWDRYNSNPSYFGGIVSFNQRMFEDINGFPNNFWGWGGEDDEMYSRIKKVELHPISPKEGTIIDMEGMSLEKKLNVLKTNANWKCMNRYELRDEHESNWKYNGLRNLKYKILNNKIVNEYTSIITVDVMLNDHWSDEKCGIDEIQYETNSTTANKRRRT